MKKLVTLVLHPYRAMLPTVSVPRYPNCESAQDTVNSTNLLELE